MRYAGISVPTTRDCGAVAFFCLKPEQLTGGRCLMVSIYDNRIVRQRGFVPVLVDRQPVGLAAGSPWIHPEFLLPTKEDKAQFVQVSMKAAIRTERHGGGQARGSSGLQDGMSSCGKEFRFPFPILIGAGDGAAQHDGIPGVLGV